MGAFMYRHSNKDLPATFRDYFSKRQEIHDYGTRNNHDYNLMKNKTKFASRGVRTSGPTTWNNLPENVKNAASIKIFRQKLKTYLLESMI